MGLRNPETENSDLPHPRMVIDHKESFGEEIKFKTFR